VEFIEAELTRYTITLGVLSFLCGTIIKFWLDKETRLFQTSLQNKLDDYKHKLDKERIRLQIAYGGIFEQQAKALLDIHRSLIDLQDQANQTIALNSTDGRLEEKFRKSWSHLRFEYSKNRALLPQEIDEIIDDFLKKIFKAVSVYQNTESRFSRTPSPNEIDKLLDKQDRALDIIFVEIPQIEQKIVESMRGRLGVSNDL